MNFCCSKTVVIYFEDKMSDFATCSVFSYYYIFYAQDFLHFIESGHLLRCCKMKYIFFRCWSFHFYISEYSGEGPHSYMTFKRIYAFIFYDYYMELLFFFIIRVSKWMISSFRCIKYITSFNYWPEPVCFEPKETQRFRLPFKRS